MAWKFTKQDWFFLAGLLLFAVLMHFGRIGSSIHGTVLATDPAMYCSIAAALGSPEAFANDFSFGIASNFATHVTPLVRLVAWIAEEFLNGNCGLAYLSLTGFVVFLHYAAFYLLGRVVFEAPWKALLFSILTGMCYWTPWGTYWGAGYQDYTPRVIFNGFYALFLCALLFLLKKRACWPLLLFLLAGTVYIHPVSALPAAAGIWLSLAFSKDENCPMGRHIMWLCVAGACFLVGILPYAATYLHSSSMTLSPDEVAYMQEILRTRFDREYADFGQGMLQFYKQYTLLPVLPLALGATWLLARYGNEKERLLCRHIWLWTAGVYIVAAIFLADQFISSALGRVHLEFDLVRVHRFLPFFWMFLIFLGCNLLWRLCRQRTDWKKYACGVFCAGVCLGFFLGGLHTMARVSLPWYWLALDEGRYEKAYAKELARYEMLTALQKVTKPDETIFTPLEDQAVRYLARRSLTWCWKDACYLYYAKNLPALHRWEAVLKDLAKSPTAYIAAGIKTGADYIVSDRPEDRALLTEMAGPVVWENSGYVIVRNEHKQQPDGLTD